VVAPGLRHDEAVAQRKASRSDPAPAVEGADAAVEQPFEAGFRRGHRRQRGELVGGAARQRDPRQHRVRGPDRRQERRPRHIAILQAPDAAGGVGHRACRRITDPQRASLVVRRAERVLTQCAGRRRVCPVRVVGIIGPRQILDGAERGKRGGEFPGRVVHGLPEVVVLGARLIVRVGDARVVGVLPVRLEPDLGAGHVVAVRRALRDAVHGIRGLVADHLADAAQG
jgi:hypothetical protein